MTAAWWIVGGLAVIIVVVGAGMWLLAEPAVAPTVTPLSTGVLHEETDAAGSPQLPEAEKISPASPAPFEAALFTATKTPHFVSSDPANNAVVTVAPARVNISFNFDVVPHSDITVSRDGVDVTGGPVVIAADKLSTACWPDQSCHDGSFGFTVQLAP
jgi:hypothetical protein